MKVLKTKQKEDHIKKPKKPTTDKFDPSRKNKKHYMKYPYENI